MQCSRREKRKVMNKVIGAGEDQIKGTTLVMRGEMNELSTVMMKDKVTKSFGSR